MVKFIFKLFHEFVILNKIFFFTNLKRKNNSENNFFQEVKFTYNIILKNKHMISFTTCVTRNQSSITYTKIILLMYLESD